MECLVRHQPRPRADRVNKLMDELATIALAELDAETRFSRERSETAGRVGLGILIEDASCLGRLKQQGEIQLVAFQQTSQETPSPPDL